MRIKPYDPNRPRKPTTRAQNAARERSFRIFRLRGLHSFAAMLTGERRYQMEDAVDEELRLMGVETEGNRQHARRARLDAEHAVFEASVDGASEFEEVQF